MDFIIIFVIIGAVIIGLNQLEKQRKAEKIIQLRVRLLIQMIACMQTFLDAQGKANNGLKINYAFTILCFSSKNKRNRRTLSTLGL
jgi:hypothetical protein